MTPSSRVEAALAAGYVEKTAALLARETGLDPSDVQTVLDALANAQRVVVLAFDDTPTGYLSRAAWERVEQTARRAAAAYHKQNPYKQAMPLGDLRVPLAKAATFVHSDPRPVAYALHQAGILVWEAGKGVWLPGHTVEMPPGWQAAAAHIVSVYQSAGLSPPAPDNFQANFPRDINVQIILQILVETGPLVRISGGDLLLHADTIETVKTTLRDLAQTPGGITVASLRDATGSSRKIILPLLEWLDAQKFTRRVGDERVLV